MSLHNIGRNEAYKLRNKTHNIDNGKICLRVKLVDVITDYNYKQSSQKLIGLR